MSLNPSLSRKEAAVAGLASALGLLAETAPAQVISFNPSSPIDSGYWNVAGVSWEPMAYQYAAGDAGVMYPGPYSILMYGCFGYLELCSGNAGTNVGVVTAGVGGDAVRLSVGATIDDSSMFEINNGGWTASVDTNGYTWGEHFYLGFCMALDGSENFNYGYAEVSADFNGSQTSVQLYRWAYESTPDTPITITAIPEPGTFLLLLCGVLMAAFRRRRIG